MEKPFGNWDPFGFILDLHLYIQANQQCFYVGYYFINSSSAEAALSSLIAPQSCAEALCQVT